MGTVLSRKCYLIFCLCCCMAKDFISSSQEIPTRSTEEILDTLQIIKKKSAGGIITHLTFLL